MKAEYFTLIFFLLLSLFIYAQEPVWTQLEADPPYGGDGRKVAVDMNDNIYVCSVWSYPGWWDHGTSVIKYSPEGEKQWISSYLVDTASLFAFEVNDIGQSFMIFNEVNFFVYGGLVAIDSNGTQLYSIETHDHCFYDLACDNEGNAYVTGFKYNSWSDFDLVVIKYNIEGEEVWQQIWSLPSMISVGRQIVINGTNIYVGGNSSNSNVILKYDINGSLVSSEFFFEDPWWEYTFRHLRAQVDNSGNIYMYGSNEAAEGYIKHGFIYKFNEELNELWHDTTSLFDQSLSGASFDQNHNIIIGGYDRDSNFPIFLKYNEAGEKLWHNQLEDGYGFFRNCGTKADRIYLIGYINYPDSTSGEMILYTTNQQGEFVSQFFYPGPTNSSSHGYDLVIDHNHNLITTGSFEDPLEYCLTIKYDLVTGSRYKLKRNDEGLTIYPNPASRDICVTIESIDETLAELMLFNSEGYLLRKAQSVSLKIGMNRIFMNITDLPVGTYFVTLKSPVNFFSNKLIINR